MKKKTLLLIILCMSLMTCLIVLALAVTYISKPYNSQLTILNQTQFPISNIQVIVCKETLNFENIKPSESRTMEFIADTDGDYNTIVIFDNGQILKANLGYVTSGIRFDDVISVEPNGLKIKSQFRNSSN